MGGPWSPLNARVHPWTYTTVCSFLFIYHLSLVWLTTIAGVSKGVGFIRFDQRNEAERAIQELNGKVPKGCTDPITVKFANNPSNNAKAMPPLAAYLTPQARRFAAGAALPAGRFRLASSCSLTDEEVKRLPHLPSSVVCSLRSPVIFHLQSFLS